MLALREIPKLNKKTIVNTNPQEIAFIEELNQKLNEELITYTFINNDLFRQYAKEQRSVEWLKEHAN